MSHKNSIAGSSKNPLECRVFQWHTELDLWSAWVALLEIELVSLPWDTVLTQNTQRVTHNTSPLGLSLTHVVHRLSLASPWPVTEGKEQRLFRKHYVIWNPSKIFEFLLIATLPTFLKFDMLDLCHWNHGPGPEMVHKLGFRYIITSPHYKYWDVTIKVPRLQWVSHILVWGWNWCTNGATARRACVIWYTLLQKWTPLCVG